MEEERGVFHRAFGMHEGALYVASTMAALWGVGQLLATKGAVKGFGELSLDNRRILTMEWIVESVALISIAAFVVVATAVHSDVTVSSAVNGVAIGTFVALAGVSLATGFKVACLPFRLCPVVFLSSAVLIAWGAWW